MPAPSAASAPAFATIAGMAAPPSGPNRGQLLRAITLTTAEILTTHARHVHATERLAAESATKSDALASIAAAEEELAVLEAQRKFESENDAELSALQVRSAESSALRCAQSGCGRLAYIHA